MTRFRTPSPLLGLALQTVSLGQINVGAWVKNALAVTHGVVINDHLIKMAHCSTGARYKDEPSTQTQALHANIAALGIYDTLSKSPQIEKLLADYYKEHPAT